MLNQKILNLCITIIALKIKEGASHPNPDKHTMKYDWVVEKFVAVIEPEVPVFDLHQIGQYSSTTQPAYTNHIASTTARNNEQPRHDSNSSICYLKHN